MSGPATSKNTLSLVLILAGTCSVIVIGLVFWTLGGWEYYRTPLATRGYMPAHKWLRPSGIVGLPLGVAGAIAMVSTLPYAVRKHWRPLARFGSTSKWLEVHIFFGIVGPVLVTLHTAFKFNGVVAVGYWLMIAVWSSGFVGRYLYVRIPKTIRGVELSRQELAAELGRLEASMHATGEDPATRRAVAAATAEHATLVRRIAHLERTRRLFAYWHVFHRPLVYGMFLIVGLHVGLAIYLGYAQLLIMANR